MRNVMAELGSTRLRLRASAACVRSPRFRTGRAFSGIRGRRPGDGSAKPVISDVSGSPRKRSTCRQSTSGTRITSKIAIRAHQRRATLSVRDNGIGFDPKRVENRTGGGWAADHAGAGRGRRGPVLAESGLNTRVQVLVEYHVKGGVRHDGDRTARRRSRGSPDGLRRCSKRETCRWLGCGIGPERWPRRSVCART